MGYCRLYDKAAVDPDLDIPGLFTGSFYNCAGDEDLLNMAFTFEKDREILFAREDTHR